MLVYLISFVHECRNFRIELTKNSRHPSKGDAGGWTSEYKPDKR